MDNMTAKVSCFARAYHHNVNEVHVFDDDMAGKLLGTDSSASGMRISHLRTSECQRDDRKLFFEI